MVERIRTLLESRQLTPTQFADLIGVARPIVSHILSGRNKPSLEVVQRILAAMPDLAMAWLLNGSGTMLAVASASTDIAGLSAATPAPLVPAGPVAASLPEWDDLPQSSENQQYSLVKQGVIIPKMSADAPVGRHASKAVENAGRVSSPAPFKPTATPKRFVAKPLAVDKPGTLGKLDAPEQAEITPEPDLAPIGASTTTTDSELFQTPLLVADVPVANASGAVSSGTPDANSGPTNAMAQALFSGGEKPIRRIVIFYRDGSFADYQPE